MSTVSIIIPAHNVEHVLPRCLDSLLAQHYKDWEAIVVDDGSTDATPAILDQYAAHDARIKAIHQPNQGVSMARNNAMEQASGEYVLYVDGDDFLHPKTLEICLSLAQRDQSDLVTFTYSRSYRTRLIVRHLLHLKEPRRIQFPEFRDFPTQFTEDILDWATEYSHPKEKLATKHCQPWRALYRKSIVENIRFIPGIIYEDFPWWSEVLLHVKRATLTALQLYYYYPSPHGYILSSKQAYRIQSLKTALAAAQELYSGAEPGKREKWEKNFLKPFQDKLEDKLRRYSESGPESGQ